MRRLRIAAVAAIVSGLGAAAWFLREPPPVGSLVWRTCLGIPARAARCATLTVPENPRDPSGRTIPLRIVILPPTGADPAADPVFVLAGGPGEAATGLIGAEWVRQSPLRARRALVFVDQRGTGGSHALQCRFYGPDAQSFFGPFMPPARVRACRAALEREADLTQYTTAASVDDLEHVREALGFDRLNLDGGSYGTRLALEYIRVHGDRVRAAVLDGVVPPSVPMPERFGVQAQRALDGILTRCAADPACVRDVPHPADDARAAFARVAAAPVTATILHAGRPATVTLRRETVAEAIRYMTYSAGAAGRVPHVLHAAAGGDFDAIARFLYDWRAGGTFDALYLSITCAEDVPFVGADAEAADDRTYLTAYRIREQRAACREWPRGAVPAWHRQPVVSDVPVLLFSGSLDPVTPPSGAEEVARHLSQSRSFVVPGGAHTLGARRTDPCVAAVLRAFLDTARVTDLRVPRGSGLTICASGSGPKAGSRGSGLKPVSRGSGLDTDSRRVRSRHRPLGVRPGEPRCHGLRCARLKWTLPHPPSCADLTPVRMPADLTPGAHAGRPDPGA